MSNSTEPRKPAPGFARTFVVPALWIFLVPVLAGAFFWHAKSGFDQQLRDSFLENLRTEEGLTAEERAEAEQNISQLTMGMLLRDPAVRQMIPEETQTYYRTFQWMLLVSIGAIALAILTFIVVGMCVVSSLYSQQIQYLSLAFGWQLIKLAGVVQIIAQGTLLVALSYWVTALWFNIYVPKLIFLVGFMVLAAVCMLLLALFKRVKMDLPVEGVCIDEAHAPKLWDRLKSTCEKLGTKPPNYLIAGIADSFYVTEQPVKIGDKLIKGRSLFVSLPLLKILSGAEADAVLSHEMAHFSGNDTLYSRRIAPLLMKYENYLEALRQNPPALPVYYWMTCFRALFELSLSRHSRNRELRADSIAAQQTSPKDLGAALLKILSYSKYRAKVERELFNRQHVLEGVAIGAQIEQGYNDFAQHFVYEKELADLRTSHPFDSHPCIESRFKNLGLSFEQNSAAQLLAAPGDGRWFHEIEMSTELEHAQWDDFEAEFKAAHEQSLPFRYLPSNEHERDVVVKAFPEHQYTDKKGTLTIDFEKVVHATWESAIHFSEITECSINEGTIFLQYTQAGVKKKQNIVSSKFGKSAAEMLTVFQSYYHRHCTAVAFQKHLEEQTAGK